MQFKNELIEEIKAGGIDFINELNELIFKNSPMQHNPVGFVKWVPIDQVQANDYNPNIVASMELKLLGVSISHDGYTQPIVTIYDKDSDKYVIVDGFHRYLIMKTNKSIKS